jgi:hypothetical protein
MERRCRYSSCRGRTRLAAVKDVQGYQFHEGVPLVCLGDVGQIILEAGQVAGPGSLPVILKAVARHFWPQRCTCRHPCTDCLFTPHLLRRPF